MIRVLRGNQYRVMPWKNGRGETSQIAIEPAQASFPEDDFLWRLSATKIASDGPFSEFVGYDRLLVVWAGQGLFLDEQKLEPLTPLAFSGDRPMTCRLVGGDAYDLGVMFKRDRVTASMTTEMITAAPMQFEFDEATHFLFGASGEAEIGGVRLGAGETLRIDGASSVAGRARAGSSARVIRVRIALI